MDSPARGPRSGTDGASPILKISIGGALRSAIPCGCCRHSSALLSLTPQHPRSASASSSACASQVATVRAIASASSAHPSSASVPSRERKPPCRSIQRPFTSPIERSRRERAALESGAANALIQVGAQRRRGSAHINPDLLRRAAAKTPRSAAADAAAPSAAAAASPARKHVG